MTRRESDAVHLLLIDDEPGFAEMTSEFLEREDEQFSIKTAASAEEGLDYISEHRIDCIVSDYNMPGQNGIEFLESVRTENPHLPFILFTGKGSEEVASEAISAGVTEYMQKGSGTEQYTVLANRIKNSVRQYRAEQETERTKRRLQELTESTTDSWWMFTSDWDDLLYISGYEDVWKRSATAIKDNPQEFLDGVHPDDRQSVRQGMEQLSNGNAADMEYRILRGDDTTGWVWVKGEPVFDDEGNVIRVVGLTRDITERKEHEQELEQTTGRMEFVLRSFDSGIWEYDYETETLSGYPEPCPIFGMEFDSLNGFFEKIQPMYHGQLENAIQRAVEAGENVRTEVRPIEDVDAEWIEIELRPVLDDDDEVTVLAGLTRDITDRKTREKRLEALNRTTQELMAAETRQEVAEIGVEAAGGIFGLRANAIHLYDDDRSALAPVAVTDTARELIGEPPTFTESDSIAWRVYEEGEPYALDDVHDDSDIYNPDTPVQSELHLPLGDRGLLLASSQTAAAFEQEDVVIGEILASNITTALEQVEWMEQLCEREQELTRQNDRLKEFAGIVSHDIRNPLTTATGYLELAREDGDPEQFDRMADALERIERITEDVLYLAREGQSIGATAPVDVLGLAADAWQQVSFDTPDAELVTGDVDSIVVEADDDRLQQLLENLLQNAIDHGGQDVTVCVGTLDDEIGFYVEDTGPGIPVDERDAIFEMGYSVTDGTGFGLAIVEEIASAHGWEITVVDGEEGGTRFEIRVESATIDSAAKTTR